MVNAARMLSIVNGTTAVTSSYVGQDNQRHDIVIPSLKESVKATILANYDVPQEVIDWWRTVFLNWLLRTSPDKIRAVIDTHADDAPLFMQIGSYLDNITAEQVFGLDPEDPAYPNSQFYSAEIGDNRWLDDVMAHFPKWARDGVLLFPAGFEVSYDILHFNDVSDYLEYLLQSGTSLRGAQVPVTFAKSTEWHRSNKKILVTPDIEGTDIRTIMSFTDGYRIVQLLTVLALDREGYHCDHCLGRGTYDKRLISGSSQFYSLRDNEGKSDATIQVSKGTVLQIKGRSNGAIAETVRHHVKDFILAAGFAVQGDHTNIGLKRLNLPS